MRALLLGGLSLAIALVLTIVKLQRPPDSLPPAQIPGRGGPALALLSEAPPTRSPAMPMPITPGDPAEAARIPALLAEQDPHLQLWALEAACWLHDAHPEQALSLAQQAISSGTPRAQVAGVAVLGCQPSRAQAIVSLKALLDGGQGEPAAVAAAIELARLDATALVGEVAGVQVDDAGLALLVDWAAWCLGQDDPRFSPLQRPGL